MKRYCPVCWADNPGDATRCIRCGAPLDAPAVSYDEALIAALTHPEPTTPVRAAWILGQRRVAAAVEPLRGVLRGGTDAYVLQAAAMALQEIGDASATPELVATLRSGPLIARIAAATALGALGGAEARPALEQVARDDPNESVRDAARSALAAGHAPTASPS